MQYCLARTLLDVHLSKDRSCRCVTVGLCVGEQRFEKRNPYSRRGGPMKSRSVDRDDEELVAVPRVDRSHARSSFPLTNRIGRGLWGVIWLLLFRPSPRIAHAWRRLLLRLFGARIGRGVQVYPSARIWAPWNLEMGDHSHIGTDVDCYCVAPVRIGAHAMVSPYSFLCAAGRDYTRRHMPLITGPIVIGDGAWVAVDVFVGLGVTIGEGAVVGARSSVFRNVEPWTVVAGSPARFMKARTLTEE
jgi:putative colanic acid biosynthesis acetyltransferase WcaF